MVQHQLLTIVSGQSSAESEMASNTSSSSSPMDQCVEGSTVFHSHSTNTSDLIPNLNEPESHQLQGVPPTTSHQEKLDNLITSSGSLTSSYDIYSALDNHQSEHIDNNMIDNCTQGHTEAGYFLENEYPKEVKPRTRNDSTESIDTVDSSSSGEIFNSAYTDTVSSTTSLAFLIKSPSDSDLESQGTIYVGDAASNDGYMSYSSCEVLDDTDDDSKEIFISLKTQTEEEKEDNETEPMIEKSATAVCDETEQNVAQTLNSFVHHSLSPIHENSVVSFIEEVEPRQYTRITDNIIIADESFLFNSATNLGDLEFGKSEKRAATMSNIHERSSFLDLTEVSKVGRVCQKALIYLKDDMTLGSLASLNTMLAKENAKDPSQSLSLISGSKTQVLKKSNYMKNLIALSISITLLYIAIGSVRNLQSSINHEGGVGVIGLAVNFVGYVVGSMFSSSIVQNFQPRRCIIVNLLPNLLYIAANLYPTMWVMVPISLIQGLSLAIVSNATSTYITFLAKGCAEQAKFTFAQVSGKFFGTYCLLYQSHIIIGNLIASFILEPPAESSSDLRPLANFINASTGFWSNASSSSDVQYSENISMFSMFSTENQTESKASHLQLCGAGFCHHFEIGGSKFSVDIETKTLLFGVYIGCIILSLLNAIFFMEPLNKDLFKSTVSPLKSFKSQMSSIARFFVNTKFLLLLPLLMYSAMQFAFVSAEFIKAYVACPLGIHMIGYTMICFGICSSASSYFCGLLNKHVGRIPFVIAAAVLNLVCLIYMYMWQPSLDSLVPYFMVMGVWGITDGFWITQTNSLMGVIFPTQYEEAYAGLRMTQGLSVAVAFGYSSALCMTLKIYIMVVMCVIGLVGYLVMETKHRRENTKPSYELKVTSV